MNSRIIIYLGIGLVLAGVVWYSFLRDKGTGSLVTTENVVAPDGDADVVKTLLELRAVSLSGTIFTDPAFRALQDFGSTVSPEPVGRTNPFAPIKSATVSTSTAPKAAPRR